MASKKAKTAVAVGGAAAIIAAVVPFVTRWEGTDRVAKRDMIGTGHPLTWCHGATSADDKAVRAGQRFTPAQCDTQLAKDLPKYLTPLQVCIHAVLPVKTMGALLDAAYNAGPTAVCKSPMVAHMNAGNLSAGCAAFTGWYVRASGRVVQGLINRRADEKKFCLAGVAEGLPKAAPTSKPHPWWQRLALLLTFRCPA
jgi:lysozyme